MSPVTNRRHVSPTDFGARFCSCVKPIACPNSCATIALRQSSLAVNSVPAGCGGHRFSHSAPLPKLRTIPSFRPSKDLPNPSVYGNCSSVTIFMCMPAERALHVPQPLNCNADAASHVLPIWFRTIEISCWYSDGEVSQHTGMIFGVDRVLNFQTASICVAPTGFLFLPKSKHCPVAALLHSAAPTWANEAVKPPIRSKKVPKIHFEERMPDASVGEAHF